MSLSCSQSSSCPTQDYAIMPTLCCTPYMIWPCLSQASCHTTLPLGHPKAALWPPVSYLNRPDSFLTRFVLSPSSAQMLCSQFLTWLFACPSLLGSDVTFPGRHPLISQSKSGRLKIYEMIGFIVCALPFFPHDSL